MCIAHSAMCTYFDLSTHKSLLHHVYIYLKQRFPSKKPMNEWGEGIIHANLSGGIYFQKTGAPTSKRILSHISCTFCDIFWNIFSSSSILVEQSVVLAWLLLSLLSLLSSFFYSLLPGCSDTPFSSIVDASCRSSCSSPLACSLLAYL